MIVHAYGGLCNRLRVVLSHRAAYGRIDCVWVADGEIANAKFTDVFEPLPGVTFLEHHHRAFRTCDPCPEAPAGWQEGYRDLQLKPEHLERYRTVRPHPPYGAVHIRRTDHLEYAASLSNMTLDDEFWDWLTTGPLHIYLATDNAVTQRAFGAAAGVTCNRKIEEHPEQDSGGRRNTPLADAAIDLLVCAGASEFKGTRESSFSDAVKMLKALGGWWSC